MSVIDNIVREIETATELRCPEANRKNDYLKACWLLAVNQRAFNQLSHTHPELCENLSKIINALKEKLPELRKEHTKRGAHGYL